MNKILIGRKIEKCEKVIIKDNIISFTEDGEYIVEYTDTSDYNIIFKIDKNIKLIEYGIDVDITVNNEYIIDNGSLEIIKFYNNMSVKENIQIDLNNPGCMVCYKFANICRLNEDYTININHNASNTISNINNKSIALKNSHLNFVINSNVLSSSTGSKMNQNTRIVVMGECDTAISPNMFTPLDDIEAKHGSIIGSFKEDEIFYLMSKGINYYDTLKLLIKGYLFSNLDGIHEELKNKIIDMIDMYWR